MTRLLLIIFAGMIAHVHAETTAPSVDPTPAIYKQVDADGNTRYSDTPPDTNSETMQLDPIQSISMPKPINRPAAAATAKPVAYQKISITNPIDGTTYQNLSTAITVSAQTEPSLQRGHSVQLLMNGSALPSSGYSAQVSALDRGTHVFTAQVSDANGKILITSPAVSIHVHRSSINKSTEKPEAKKPGVLDRLLNR